ncbi:hypothetical protein ABB02_00154 [Clostridiaceae bacterium JG1575]|nr:hypothetical protein ABB02_00154 [Clostridiaceae bacterium JG1575]
MIEVRDLIIENNDGIILDIQKLNIDKQDFVCIMGKSGAGKSTLLNVIFGLIEPNKGYINVGCCDMGYSTQDASFVPYLSVLEHILVSIKEERRKIYAQKILSRFGIENKLSEYYSNLSGGQKRICSLANAIARGEKLLLLDEPFNDLDNLKIKELVSILNEINSKGTTIVMTTHHIIDNLNITNNYNIVNGKLV